MSTFKLIPFLLILVVGCTNVERVDTTAVKEHMGDYKIKKISPAEIMEQAEKFGSSVEPLLANQFNAPASGSTCDFQNSPLADSLNALSPGSVRLIRKDDLKNTKNFLPKEVEVLEAYGYSFEKKLKLETNIQQLNDTLYLFTYPVSPQSVFSKNCLAKDPEAYGVVELLLRKSFLIRQIK